MPIVYIRVSQQEKIHFSAKQAGREREFNLPPYFGSTEALNGLDGAHPHWEGLSALLSLPIQRLISSGNTPHTHTQKQRLTRCLESLGPVKLTHKIHHHMHLCLPVLITYS